MFRSKKKVAPAAPAAAPKAIPPTDGVRPAPRGGRHDDHRSPLLSEEQVRIRAYLKWEAAGRPSGDGLDFWLEAEQELRRR